MSKAVRATDPGGARESSGGSSERATFVAAAVVIAAAVILGMTVLPRISFPAGREGAGQAAPDFNLPVLHTPGVAAQDHGKARLALADLKGSPVLLDFWATWCGPCAMQTPILDRVAKRHKDKGLRVVGVNVVGDDPEAAAKYAEKKGLSYEIVVDEGGLAQREYGVNRLPSLILIDREGRILRRMSGLVDEAALDRMVQEAL